MPTTSKYGASSEIIMSGYHCTRYTVGQLPDERSELGRQGYVSGFLFLRKILPETAQPKPLFASPIHLNHNNVYYE